MDGSINPSATEENCILLYGGFLEFVVVDHFPEPSRADPEPFWRQPASDRAVRRVLVGTGRLQCRRAAGVQAAVDSDDCLMSFRAGGLCCASGPLARDQLRGGGGAAREMLFPH